MLFREVNDRIADLSASLGVRESPQGFICECTRIGCTAQIELPLTVYAAVRDIPSACLVLAGHEDPQQEQIISRQSRYLIARPHDDQADLVSTDAPTG